MFLPLVPLFVLFLSTLNPIFCQANDSGTFNVEGLVSALRTAGFTQLANATSGINQTAAGQQLIAQLSNGNYTLFAPTDQAFTNASSFVTSSNEVLAQYISYHFVHEDLRNTSYTNTTGGGGGGGSTSSASTQSSTPSATTSSQGSGMGRPSTSAAATTRSALYNIFSRSILQSGSGGSNGSSSNNLQLQSSIYPNVTLARTLLNSSDWVFLPEHESQVLAWARTWENGNVTILNQIPNTTSISVQNITVVNSTQYNNIFINGVDGVLTPPPNITTALTAINATQVENFLKQVLLQNGTNGSAIDSAEEIRGLTLFVPDNNAFSISQQEIQRIQINQTAAMTLVASHAVEDVLYTPLIWQNISRNYITGSGEPLQFTGNSSGLFVGNGNGTSAKIIRSDIAIKNGVIHVIDRVLLNTDSNPQAASSAAQSASSVASGTASTTAAGIIGGSITSGATTQMSSSSSTASSSSVSSSSNSVSSTSGTSYATSVSTTGGSAATSATLA